MGNRPEALKTFVPLYGAIMGPGSVDRRIKELVLTASYANVCAYCTARTSPREESGNQRGRVGARGAGRFSESERAVIRYARAS
jgi:alkylhydroperoxidase family enzyme